MSFQALRLHSKEQKAAELVTLIKDELSPGNVLIEVQYSSLNYKDAMALTGAEGIVKHFPITPGLDAAGIVRESEDSRYAVGTEVLVTGCGLGESRDGAYAKFLRVPADIVVPLPSGLTAREAMILGTAGFTAGLALYRMKQNDQTPDKGPILITGSSGGVGNVALTLFSQAGFEVWALSGKSGKEAHLRSLGAHKVFRPEELGLRGRPVDTIKFGGVVDNVGGEQLAKILPHVALYGNVVAIGMAGGTDLNSTLMPFLLRGVSLLGVTATNCPYPLRSVIWKQLSTEWKPKNLEAFLSGEIGLPEVLSQAKAMLARKTEGRTLVRI